MRVFAALLAFLPAFAQASFLHCHGCTEAQRESVAVTAGLGAHHAFDFPNATLQKFQVECVSPDTLTFPEDDSNPPAATRPTPGLAWNGCRGQTYAWLTPNDPWTDEVFDLVVDLYLETNGTWQKRRTIGSEGIPGATARSTSRATTTG